MSNRKYIDFDLIKKVPNKYNIKPKDIKKLKVLDWDKLKKKTWYNNAMKKTGEWYCHLEGSNGGGFYGDDEDEFWIGFDKKNSKVDYHFTSREGMCGYTFDEFYKTDEIENKWDMNVQVNAMRYLNMLLDERIVELSK